MKRIFGLLPIFIGSSRVLANNMTSCVATEIDVIIVGGGVSGMVCADEFIKAGLNVKILEARNRIGGRLLSFEGVDLGASWSFPPQETEGSRLAASLNVPIVQQRLDGDSFMSRNGGVMQNVGEMGGRMAPCGPSAVRFQGGYSALPLLLAEKMKASIVLETRVTAVESKDKHIQVTTDKDEQFNAKRVVFALPPAVLAHSVTFTPNLPNNQLRKMKETSTWCGDWCKVVAIFKSNFWNEQGKSGVVSTDGQPISIWYEGGSGLKGEVAAITGLGFGEEACERVGKLIENEEELRSVIIKTLGMAFNSEKIVSDHLLSVSGKSWALDDLTYVSGAHGREYGHKLLKQPTGWGVFFAGTETENLNGHVEGAIVAGRRAAREVLNSLKSAGN